jgi:hypothetical protein
VGALGEGELLGLRMGEGGMRCDGLGLCGETLGLAAEGSGDEEGEGSTLGPQILKLELVPF